MNRFDPSHTTSSTRSSEEKTPSTTTLERQIRSALRSLHDLDRLAKSPLAQQLATTTDVRPDQKAKRLQSWLQQSVSNLRVEHPDSGIGARENRPYAVLHMQFVEGHSREQIEPHLGFQRAEFFRQQQSGIKELARRFQSETARKLDPIPLLNETPMVGREAEIDVLKALYHEVAAGRGGRVAMISGDQGIGKTRLARELGSYARSEAALFLEGRWAAWEGSAPYGALADGLRQAVRQLTPEEVGEMVGPFRRELSRILPELAESGSPSRTDESDAPEGEQLRLYDGVFRLLQKLAEKQPLVLLLDDLHLAPQMSLQLHIARRLGDLRLLIIYAFREHELIEKTALISGRNELERRRLITEIPLLPLSENQIGRMISHVFGDSVSQQVLQPLFAVAKGNPFLAEELMRYLERNEYIRSEDYGWTVTRPLRIDIPETVKRLVQERVERLGGDAFEVLQQASVMGQNFTLDAIEEMTGRPENEMVELVERMILSGVLIDRTENPANERFAFRDEHVREALYGSITGPRQRRYHRNVGLALEKLDSGRLGELAIHFTTGGDAERGARYSFEAAEQSSRAFSWNRAIPLYRNALDLWEDLGDHEFDRAVAAEKLGNASYKSGIEAQRALDYLNISLGLYRKLGDQHKVATILSQIGREYMHSGNLHAQDLDLALEHFSEAESIVSSESESIRHGMIYCGLAMVHLDRMEFPAAMDWADKALALGERISDPAVISNACVPLGAATALESVSDAGGIFERAWKVAIDAELGFQADLTRAYAARVFGAVSKDPMTGIGWVNRSPQFDTTYSLFDSPVHLVAFHGLAGEFDEAQQHLEVIQRRLTSLGQPTFGPWPDELGLYWVRTGEFEIAESQLVDALAWSTDAGNRLVQAGVARRLGEVLTHRGKYSEAEQYFKRSLEINRHGGNRMGELALLPQLSFLYYEQGLSENVHKIVSRARDVAAAMDEVGALEGDLSFAEGLAALSASDDLAAGAAFDRAIQIFREFDRPWDEARVYLTHGSSVSRSSGRSTRQELLRKAISGFQSIGADWWANRSRSELG